MSVAEISNGGELEEAMGKQSLFDKFVHAIKRQPLGAVGAVIVFVLVVLSVFASRVTGFDPVENNFEDM